MGLIVSYIGKTHLKVGGDTFFGHFRFPTFLIRLKSLVLFLLRKICKSLLKFKNRIYCSEYNISMAVVRSSKIFYNPKTLGLSKDPLAYQVYLKALDDFRRRIRKSKFIKIIPYVDYFSVPSRKKDFLDFVSELEEFRCSSVGLREDVFYRLCAEFILVPNGVKYYNPLHLFGCRASFEAEEFKGRLFETLTYIFDSIADGTSDDEKTYEFIEKVNALGNMVEFKGVSSVFKSKDWYCIKTIHRRAKSRGWPIDELVNKIKLFYRYRIRKVYPEMLLHDLVHGELDKIEFNKVKKERKVPRHHQAIKNSDWHDEWLSQLPDD